MRGKRIAAAAPLAARLPPALVILQQTQGGAYHFARAAEAPRGDAIIDERLDLGGQQKRSWSLR